MAYIEIYPKFPGAQQRLMDECVAMMELLQAATKDVLDVPDHDIIIELNQCTALRFNSLAVSSNAVPDVVIKIATSDKELQPRFQALCDQIVGKWKKQFGNSFKLELWVNLIDSWGCNIEFC